MRTDSTIVLPNCAQKARLCYSNQVQLGQHSKGPARNAYRMTALPRAADPGSEPWIGATHRVERWLRVTHADYKKETHNRNTVAGQQLTLGPRFRWEAGLRSRPQP